jgi:hypothetical protein
VGVPMPVMSVVVVIIGVLVVMMVMTVFVRVTADFHVAAAESAPTLLAHKINSDLTTKSTKHTKPSPKKSGGVRRISRRVPLLLRLVFQAQPRPPDILQLFILSCPFVYFVVTNAFS